MTYPSVIQAEEIGSTIEKINEWLGKPVVIMCGEVTAIQLPHVIEHVCHTTGTESVVFNTGIDDMRSDSNPSVPSGYHSYAGGPAVLGASGTMLLKKMPGIPQFSGMEREEDTVRFEQWLYSISDTRKTFNDQWVKAAINKSCVGDLAYAICGLLPRASKNLNGCMGSVESFDTLMEALYQIVQGKSERVQTFVLHFEWALKGD